MEDDTMGKFSIVQDKDDLITFLPACHPQAGVSFEYFSRERHNVVIRCVTCRRYAKLQLDKMEVNFKDLPE
jgi:hypothetical protein